MVKVLPVVPHPRLKGSKGAIQVSTADRFGFYTLRGVPDGLAASDGLSVDKGKVGKAWAKLE